MNEQLLAYLFDNKPHLLAAPMSRWIGSSRRFKEFATTYRDKIRKKIRVTRSGASIKDLEVELEIAYWLLREKRIALAYEPYSSQKGRGPDFAVTFKSLTFNVEATRIGSGEMEGTAGEAATPGLAPAQAGGRLMDTVCDKLSQMRPGMINVLIVVSGSDFIRVLELNQAMARLKERAEHKEAGLFGRYGFAHTADFFKYYLRLSGVLVRPAADQDAPPPSILWANNQTKHPLPGPLRTILQ